MKRFTDTNKWSDDWFSQLPVNLKLFWMFICDNCDQSGVWNVNFKLAEFLCGCKFDQAEILEKMDGRIEAIGENKWWVVRFIEFQCGKLSLESRVHQSVIKETEKHGIEHLVSHLIVEKSSSIGALRKRLTSKAKEAIFSKDGFRCQYCGNDSFSLLRVDHIVPLVNGGTNEDENLTTSCVSCNSKKSDLDAFEFINRFGIKVGDSLSKKLDSLSKKLHRAKEKEKDKDKEDEKEKEGGMGETEVELPKGFPKSEGEAVAACMTLGIPDDFIKTTWNQAMGRNGRDAKDIPIARWAHYVKAMHGYSLKSGNGTSTKDTNEDLMATWRKNLKP